MAEPEIAPKGPFAVAIEAGKPYCPCVHDHSATKLACDGAHARL